VPPQELGGPLAGASGTCGPGPRSSRAANAPPWKGHQGWVNGVCAVTVAGKKLLASASGDGTVRIWDPETGACPLTVPTHYPPQATAWVAGSLAIGLGAGILVIKPRAAGWP
jgi:WD40 repeat protein